MTDKPNCGGGFGRTGEIHVPNGVLYRLGAFQSDEVAAISSDFDCIETR